MGGAGLQNQGRQLGGNVSFAQSLSGSQPATPLDLSYVLSSPLLLPLQQMDNHFTPPAPTLCLPPR